MPVRPMMCPRCGEQTSEYDKGKWQCLSCGARFIYEKPPETVRAEVELTTKFEGLTYTCSACASKFPRQAYPEYKCVKCRRTYCPTCYGVNEGASSGLCVSCHKARLKRKEMRRKVGLAILVILLALYIIFLLWVLLLPPPGP